MLANARTFVRNPRVWLGVLLVAALVIVARTAGSHLPRFIRWVDGLGPWGPIAYIAGYVVATIVFVPGALPTLAAGVIFGLAEGTLFAFIGETLGGAAAFAISRYLARPLVARRLAANPRFAAIDRAVATRGGRIVLLLRLSPAIPFNALNYALGATSIPFSRYFIASLGMLPGAFLYVYYGKLVGDLSRLVGGATITRGSEYWVLLGVGLAATLAVSMLLARIARRALEEV